jgi:hypothetical protein
VLRFFFKGVEAKRGRSQDSLEMPPQDQHPNQRASEEWNDRAQKCRPGEVWRVLQVAWTIENWSPIRKQTVKHANHSEWQRQPVKQGNAYRSPAILSLDPGTIKPFP